MHLWKIKQVNKVEIDMKIKDNTMSPKYHTFAMLILYNIASQLDNEIDDNASNLPPIAFKLWGNTKRWLKSHSFTEDDLQLIMELKDDEEFEEITMREVSFLLFALDLMRIYVETVPKEKRPILDISDKKLIKGSRIYAIDMIKLKHRDSEIYKDTKKLFRTTEEVAKDVYDYMFNKVSKHYKKDLK